MYYIVLNKICFIFYDHEFLLIFYYILFCTGQGHKVHVKTLIITDNVSRKWNKGKCLPVYGWVMLFHWTSGLCCFWNMIYLRLYKLRKVILWVCLVYNIVNMMESHSEIMVGRWLIVYTSNSLEMEVLLWFSYFFCSFVGL